MQKHTLDRWLHFSRGKLRVFASWALLIALVYCIERAPEWDGILIVLLGALIRAAASGYIDKEGRLTVAGPYGFVRNPLYLGSILIALGAAQAQHNAWLTVLVTAVLLLIHVPIMIAEERVLGEKFGEAYVAYKKAVPRLVPWRFSRRPEILANNPRIKTSGFSWSQFMHNKGYEGPLVFIGIVLFEFAVFYGKQRFF